MKEALHQLTNSYLDLFVKPFSVYVIFYRQFFLTIMDSSGHPP